MLFNSKEFILYFLPVAVIVFFILGPRSIWLARSWLAAASLFFYAWWNPIYLPLLLGSITFNFSIGYYLQVYPLSIKRLLSRKVLLWIGIIFNLSLLGYFKYAGFFVQSANDLVGTDFVVQRIALPLAISFVTFQKIAYLVDSYLEKVRETSFLNFVLFASFFPQLIAGPIVHYSEVFPQFRNPLTYRFQWDNFGEGATLFILGLAKKVVLADEFGRYSDVVFNGVAAGSALTLVPAWVGALSYTLQLYFDFSGYSDIAIGLGKMFNIELPINFFSPYKADSIAEFWRRWHMTLSRFLRDYVYIPLGGNRKGESRRYTNLMTTMLIGGLWHGAGWTFISWGFLHGVALSVHHLQHSYARDLTRVFSGKLFSQVLTLLFVIVAWVLFRAASLAAAGRIYSAMLGRDGAILPDQVLDIFHPLRSVFDGVGKVPLLGDSTVMGLFEIVVMLGLGFGLVLFAPNLYQMGRRTRLVMVGLSFAFVVQKIFFAGEISPFLYFQF